MTEKMDVLEIVLPVLVMIILGMLCRKWKLLDQNGVNNMKTLVTNIMLPVAIFHALATAKYSGKIGTLVLIMFIMLLISFGVGFLLKRFMEEPYKKYLPFLVCIYEGGMMAYPLYTSLCGSENLSQIAVLDIAGLLFGFSVYMGILTTAITPIILIVVGYSMELVPELIGPCIKTIFLRIILQAAMIMGVLIAVKYLVGSSRLLNLAIIIYMSSPATFSMQTFLKKKESSAYASTTNSLYCIVSILVYIVLAVVG